MIGISDNKPNTFTDPLFAPLGLRHARLITPWNSIHVDRPRLDEWIRAARGARQQILVAFNHSRSDRCPARPCRLPSVRSYRRAFLAFRRAYPFIKSFQPWNEANSPTQPTGKNPRRAAEYYNVVRGACRRCKVTAADILDLALDKSSGRKRLTKWLATFRRTAKGTPKLWGLHNYGDTNYSRTTGTGFFLRLVPGEVWFTETGGIVKFETQSGDVPFPFSEARAGRATAFMFELIRKNRRRVKRSYIYHWRTDTSNNRFDAGLIRADGTPRPAYRVLRENVR